jgi:hypothetical protein
MACVVVTVGSLVKLKSFFLFFQKIHPPEKQSKLKAKMSTTTIIPGVSAEVELEYLQSFNDEGLKYKFTVSIHYGPPVKQFQNCTQAAQYIYEEPFVNPDSAFRTYIISLNKSDGGFITLKDEDVSALCAFEEDEELFEMFEMFAEKMSRPGRVQALEEEDEQDDSHLIRTRRPKTFRLAADIYNERMRDCDDDYYSSDNYINALSEEGLRVAIRGLNDLLKERDIKMSCLEQSLLDSEQDIQAEISDRREDAMRQIMSMTPDEFQSRLLHKSSPKWQLPQFERARPGDEDYPDLSKPERQRAVPYSKFPFTPCQFEGGILNAGDVNRSKLRYMTEEEYIAKFYDLTPRDIDLSEVKLVSFDDDQELCFV